MAWSDTYLNITWAKLQQSEPQVEPTSETSHSQTHKFLRFKMCSATQNMICRFCSSLITVQQDATYSVRYISVGSSTCFGCWHPSSGARTAVITASGID